MTCFQTAARLVILLECRVLTKAERAQHPHELILSKQGDGMKGMRGKKIVKEEEIE